MLVTHKRKKLFFRRETAYFVENYRNYKTNADIVFFFQTSVGKKGAYVFNTLLIDLSKNQETLFHELKKDFRRQIRKAVNKDNLKAEFDPKPSYKSIIEFIGYNNEFRKLKGLCPITEKQLIELADINALTLSYIKDENNNTLCCSSIISDGFRARALQTASLRLKADTSKERNLIGSANVYLHWAEIVYFKNKGNMIYDFGGISQDEDNQGLQNINRFKLYFGGNTVTEYHFYHARTVKGKLALMLKRKVWTQPDTAIRRL
jgi:hypothetical protein